MDRDKIDLVQDPRCLGNVPAFDLCVDRGHIRTPVYGDTRNLLCIIVLKIVDQGFEFIPVRGRRDFSTELKEHRIIHVLEFSPAHGIRSKVSGCPA